MGDAEDAVLGREVQACFIGTMRVGAHSLAHRLVVVVHAREGHTLPR
jgi:hypothetical protein